MNDYNVSDIPKDDEGNKITCLVVAIDVNFLQSSFELFHKSLRKSKQYLLVNESELELVHVACITAPAT